MNRGGFSLNRFLGISAFKSKVSRQIGIPLTASGRRRKLGASIFNALGPVAGTVAVAAVGSLKQGDKQHSKQDAQRDETDATGTRLPKGVYFCLVKGVTHNNDEGMTHADAQQLCSIGDTVKLVADPHNPHDRNAIRIVLQTGQQVGFISATQAARFAGKIHLLTATVHSRVADDWGNETLKLRVVNSAEHQAYLASSSKVSGAKASATSVEALQAEAKETAQKEGWQSVFIYLENAERGLYQVVLAENAEHLRQTLGEGLVRVGFIGAKDAPKGIQFSFSLDDAFPVNGPVAQRFLTNGRDWVTTRSKNLCAEKGIAPPVIHKFEPSKQAGSANVQNAPASKSGARSTAFGIGVIVTGVLLAFVTSYVGFGLLLVLFATLFLIFKKRSS